MRCRQLRQVSHFSEKISKCEKETETEVAQVVEVFEWNDKKKTISPQRKKHKNFKVQQISSRHLFLLSEQKYFNRKKKKLFIASVQQKQAADD